MAYLKLYVCRELKLKQKQNHEKLAMNKAISLYPDTKYYIIPSAWLSKWRSYINASGKNACSVELDNLNTVIDMLLCEKVRKIFFSDICFNLTDHVLENIHLSTKFSNLLFPLLSHVLKTSSIGLEWNNLWGHLCWLCEIVVWIGSLCK